MSAASWGVDAKTRLQSSWEACSLTRAAVSGHRSEAIKQIGEGNEDDHARLAGLNRAGQLRMADRVRADPLSRCISRHRESLGQAVVSTIGDDDDEVKHWLFVLASKNPIKAHYLPLTPLDPETVYCDGLLHLPRHMCLSSFAWQLHLGPDAELPLESLAGPHPVTLEYRGLL